MKDKTNLLLAAVLAVLVLIYVFTGTGRNVETRMRFFAADSSNLAFIELYAPGDTLALAKQVDGWQISHPYRLPVQKRSIENIYKNILDAQTSTTPVAEQEASFKEYGVDDSTATLVRFLDGNHKPIDEFYLGASKDHKFSYARGRNDKKIYRLETNLTTYLRPSLDSWRERLFLNFTEQEIGKIEVKAANMEYTLVPADSVWRYNGMGKSFDVKKTNQALTKLLRGVENARAMNFYDNQFDQYKNLFDAPIVAAKIENWTGATTTFEIVKTSDDKYIVRVNNQGDHLYGVGANYVDTFTVSSDHFAN